MGQFMIHTINSLKKNGRFCLVIDRGILNNGTDGNSWQKELRQFMLETCNIDMIILLPKGIFATTTFDTAIIYGQKKVIFEEYNMMKCKANTKEIKFYEAQFIDAKNKKGLDVPSEYINITFEMIVNKDWSLKYEDYTEKKDNNINGIIYKPLGEVCDYNIGFTPSTKDSSNFNDDNLWCTITDLNSYEITTTERKISHKAVENKQYKLIIIYRVSVGT